MINNLIQFHFSKLLIIIQQSEDKVHFISWNGEHTALSIQETIDIIEKKISRKNIKR